MPSFFETQGITRESTLKEIRKAYKRLSLLFHPDKDRSPGATERFKAILNEFESLTAKPKSQKTGLIQESPYLVEYKNPNGKFIPASSHSPNQKYAFFKKDLPFSNDELMEFFRQRLQKEPYATDTTLHELDEFQITNRILVAISKFKKIPHLINETAFLWKAEKDGYGTIFIFGTQHVFTFDFIDIFEDAIKNILSWVEIVFTEIYIHIKNFPEPVKSLEGHPLMEPDRLIGHFAYLMKKTIKALENDKIREISQCSFENEMKEILRVIIPGFIPLLQIATVTNQDDDYINWAITNFPLVYELNKHYLTHTTTHGSINEIDSVAKRNFFWMKRIMENPQQNKLIVDGAGHNSGKYGLPNLLASQGWNLTPLMKTAPIPKSLALREAIRQGEIFLMFAKQKDRVKSQEQEPLHRKKQLTLY